MPPQSNLNPLGEEDNQNILISQIANGLAATTDLIQSLSTDIKGNTISLTTIRTELTSVTDDVRTLSVILKDGNGNLPVLSRIAILETKVKEIEKKLVVIQKTLDSLAGKTTILQQKFEIKAEESKLSAEDRKSRRAVYAAIITSIFALIAAVASALIG